MLTTKYIVNNLTGQTINGASILLTYEVCTYSELYNKTINSELTPGQWYRLTDYKSVNFLNGWQIANINPIPTDPNFNPREIYTGETEVLLLQATTTSEISPIGYSESFSQDIITYLPLVNKIGIDIGGIYNGKTLPDLSVVSGFDLQWDGTNVYFDMPTGYPALYGHYFYLYAEFDGGNYYQDGTYEPLTPNGHCQYPNTNDDPDYNYPKTMSRITLENDGTKVILLDLTETDYNNYVADTLYVEHIYALGDAYGWITRRTDTQSKIDIPFDFRARKYRRFEVDLSLINLSFSLGYYGQGDNYQGQGTTGIYRDLFSIDWKGYKVYNLEIDGQGGPDMHLYVGYNGYNDNNVVMGPINNCKFGTNVYNNTFKEVYSNIIGDFFYGNTFGGDFYENYIKTSFFSNTIGDGFIANKIDYTYSGNIIGSSFIGNTIGRGFVQNTISDYFNNNIIGGLFQGSTIGSSFQFNEILFFFQSNTTGNNFQKNRISYSLDSTNFSGATHVYNDYNCEIFMRSNGSLRLSYVDGSSTVLYVVITT